jgi:hypothetical protein
MRYMAGYQLQASRDFMETILRYKEDVSEVYFAWGDLANGRNRAADCPGFPPWEAQEKQIKDLAYLSDNGIKLSLLLNSNCYGKYSLSKQLFRQIDESVGFLYKRFGLQAVTTTSPVIAGFLKDQYQGLEVRASVNMGIGTIQGMEYVSGYFDSFYMRREHNRDKRQIKKLKNWCDGHGKKLYLLANSGCLNHCSAHVFHDNLVAHEDEIIQMDNAAVFEGLCWKYLKEKDRWASFLTDTSFIRPEEMHLYEKWFDEAKLATRVNAHPEKVLESYISKEHSGSILALCEPDHSGLLYPYLIENRRLPADLIERQLDCDKDCEECDYCSNALDNALVDLEVKLNC